MPPSQAATHPSGNFPLTPQPPWESHLRICSKLGLDVCDDEQGVIAAPKRIYLQTTLPSARESIRQGTSYTPPAF